MIEKQEVAAGISQLMVEFLARLDASVAQIKNECSAAEFETYRTAVGKIMGEMVLEVMNPLYQRHPELKPKEME
jgi:hypothetical protein